MCKIDYSKFKDISSEFDFCQMLINEESVYFLPGTCFFAKGMFRAMICKPDETLTEMGVRVKAFCKRHLK